MLTLLNKPYKTTDISIRDKIVSSVIFGLFIFLFLFIFQPFGLGAIEPWLTRFLISAGFGIITIFMLIIIKTLLDPVIIGPGWTMWKDILYAMFTASSIGVANYFYISVIFRHPFVFKIFLITIWSAWLVAVIPVSIGYILYFNKVYRDALKDSLIEPEAVFPEEEIMLRAGNLKNDLRLVPKNILYLCSNDNYVTIFTISGTTVSRNTIRGTLKSAEAELKKYKRFLRCHKCYIVNLDHVLSVRGNNQNMTIILQNTPAEIPVSRSMAPHVSRSIRKNHISLKGA